jgi:hypothetical protein
MAENESKQSLNRRAEQLLERAAKSPVAMAARAFQDAGFSIQIGHCYRDGSNRYRGIDLIVRTVKQTPDWDLDASWHIALAPGKHGVLVLFNNSAESVRSEPNCDFRPLANDAFDRLLRIKNGQFDGMGLLDAPRMMADGMAEAFGKHGAAGKDHRAMLRAVQSAQQALKPSLDTITRARPAYRFAAPALVTGASLFEASGTDDAASLVESCFAAVGCESKGPRSVDVVAAEFITTYARMAGETVSALPELIASTSNPRRPPPSTSRPLSGVDLIDAWDAFRES